MKFMIDRASGKSVKLDMLPKIPRKDLKDAWGSYYSVEIDSLKEILKLVDKVGGVIISKRDPEICNDQYDYHIQIYDDYIE